MPKGVSTPGEASKKHEEEEEDSIELPVDRATLYRSVAARANYLAADRPEVQFAAEEACGWMAKPTELARWLKFCAGVATPQHC